MGEETRYERIIRLIEQSEGAKSDAEIRAGRIADKAAPVTFAAAALTWFFTHNGRKAASVLTVDYSCAVKLATPLAFLAAIREGLENGVFFKGGAPLEKLARCDTVVFDKTGTLTLAAPALARIIPYHGFSESSALKIAACLEEHFPHPVAKAVVNAAQTRHIRHREAHSAVKYIAAHGIASAYRGKHTVIGSRHFVGEDEGVDLSIARDDLEAAKTRLRQTPGIGTVEINPRTGSLLIEYDTAVLSPAKLLKLGRAELAVYNIELVMPE